MQCIRYRFLIALVLGFALVFTAAANVAADGHFEYGLNREPNGQPLALTNDAVSNATESELDANTDVVAAWLLGESGSGSYAGAECAGLAGMGQADNLGYTLAWGAPRLFPAPDNLNVAPDVTVVTPLQDMNVTIEITSTEDLPQPIAQGDVTFTMEVGWVRPPPRGSLHGPHGPWTGTTTVSPVFSDEVPLPIPGGVLPASVDVPVTFSEEMARLEAEAALVFFLTVECEAEAFFNISFGDIGELQWVWGDPAEDDTDSDGIPDSLDTHPDGTEWSRDEQVFYGTNPLDPNDIPSNDSEDCPGLTIQEAKDENENYQRGQPSTCPDDGGIPWLLLFLALLLVVLLVGGAFGAVTTVNKKVRMTVSHDGFQDIKQGESAQYELLLTAKGKEDEEVPVELSLKGVPEDWSASVDPAHMTLIAGEEPEPVTASLTVTPPPEEEYEAEAVVTVTATPTDEDGKTSPIKPGTAVKTKTIVNIDVEPPEGEKRKKVRKPKPTQEPGAAMEEEPGEGEQDSEDEQKKGRFSKMKGGLGLLSRKKKDEEATEEEAGEAEAGEQEEGEPAAEAGAAGAAGGTGGKPDLAVGKLAHDPADFSAGDEVTTTVPVKNKGGQAVEGLMLRLYVNDDRVDEKEVNLEPGAASEVTFTWTAQPDENRVRVRGGLKEA